MNKILKSIALLPAAISMLSTMWSCDEPTFTTRSVLVYMAANNNLSYYAKLDLEEMKEGAKDIKGGRLLVYYHVSGNEPKLIEVTPDGNTKTLKTYDTAESSVSITRMRQVIADVKSLDNDQRTGLVFWSHGTGWLSDKGSLDEDGPKSALQPYSFGTDNTRFGEQKMKLTSLRRALEGNTYDFIYFDCCHMATVEVAYELRKLTPVIAGCPTELGLEGMPYEKNLACLFAKTADIAGAVKNTYDFYNAQATNGCCISVINTTGLDRLAELSREALKKRDRLTDYTPVPYFRTSIMSSGIYDMKHYFNALLTGSGAELDEWVKAYDNVLSKTYTTATVYGLDASNFNGIGCNVITSTNTPSKYGYDETAWYTDVVAPSIENK